MFNKMKKIYCTLLIISLVLLLTACTSNTSNTSPTDSDPTSNPTSSDYFKQCFSKLEGDWYDGGHKISFYIEDDLYMVTGWNDNPRVIATFEPVQNEDKQFEIGIEDGDLLNYIKCEIVEENSEILLNSTKYIRRIEKEIDEESFEYNRVLIAEALEVSADDKLDNILYFLDDLAAGKIQKATFEYVAPDSILHVIAEDGTKYTIYMNSSNKVLNIQNETTGEWVVTSEM